MVSPAVIEMARAENERARKSWDDNRHPAKTSPIEHDLKMLLGQGLTQEEAAAKIGCVRSTVAKILKKKGWKL